MTSPHETLTIDNYPEDRFLRLQQTLAKEGLHLEGESGEAKDYGAVVDYKHEGTTLTLTILHGPHLHNFDDFVTKLTNFVKAQV